MISNTEIQIASIASQAQRVAYARKGDQPYEWPGRVSAWARRQGLTELKTFDNEGSQAFMVWSDKQILIAFRGTEACLSDVFSDIDGRKLKLGKGVKVHFGFNSYMSRIGKEIHEKFKTIYKGQQIVLGCHSLGAAAAQAYAFDFLQHDGVPSYADIHIHLFGSPRYGNAAFRKLFNEAFPDAYRWVNSADGVPHLPPAIPTVLQYILTFILRTKIKVGGFRHVGKLMWFDTCGAFLPYQPKIIQQWSDIACSIIRHIGVKGLASVRLHSSTGYEKTFREAFRRQLKREAAA